MAPVERSALEIRPRGHLAFGNSPRLAGAPLRDLPSFTLQQMNQLRSPESRCSWRPRSVTG